LNPRTHVAGYATREVALQMGDLALRLLVVDHLERYVDAEALLRDPTVPEPPYWAHLWVGSRALARLVATQIDCADSRIIDVGCGLGLAGIVGAMRGARVTMIDTMDAALRFAVTNAARNHCQVAAVHTDIRQPGLRGEFECCLAADVTYDPILQIALANFLAAHLARDGRAWCAESVRTTDHGFRDACASNGFEVTEREIREVDEGRSVPVRITEVHR